MIMTLHLNMFKCNNPQLRREREDINMLIFTGEAKGEFNYEEEERERGN